MLSGCGTFGPDEEDFAKLNTYKGQSIDAAIRRIGPPTSESSAGSGKVVRWTNYYKAMARTSTQQVCENIYVNGEYNRVCYDEQVTTQGTDSFCHLDFLVSKDGIVTDIYYNYNFTFNKCRFF